MIFTLRKGGTELFDTGSHICRYGVEFEVLPGTESLPQALSLHLWHFRAKSPVFPVLS